MSYLYLLLFSAGLGSPQSSGMGRALRAEEYKRYISAPSSGNKFSYGQAESRMMIHKVMLGLLRVVVQQPFFDNDSYCHASLVEQLTRSPESDHFAILAKVPRMKAVWLWVLDNQNDGSEDLSWWADTFLGGVKHAVTKMMDSHKIRPYLTVFQVATTSGEFKRDFKPGVYTCSSTISYAAQMGKLSREYAYICTYLVRISCGYITTMTSAGGREGEER
jgi:hypothetical protein